jgi:phospholipid/cholesterol/gamma-HCH transport system substrate-binding protein
MTISKELKTGIIAIFAIALLVLGVNFLKGNSFFGGDDVYYAYFSNSGGVVGSSSVIVNGVEVGKVLKVELTQEKDSSKRVLISFNIQDDNFRIPRSSKVEVGALDFFTKGMIIEPGSDLSKGFYNPGDKIQGVVSVDIISQVKSYVEPINQKLQKMMNSVDGVIGSISAFWDTTATSSLEGSMQEVKIAIKRFGNVAIEVEGMVQSEKVQLHNILRNVDEITTNLKLSNDKITAIVGNTKKITDDLVTADFKTVIGDAQKTIKTMNDLMKNASEGKGTLGMLLNDQKLYDELVNTNKELQNLVNDLQLHPERYVHFSVLGAKTKGVPITKIEEKKLRKLLDSLP